MPGSSFAADQVLCVCEGAGLTIRCVLSCDSSVVTCLLAGWLYVLQEHYAAVAEQLVDARLCRGSLNTRVSQLHGQGCILIGDAAHSMWPVRAMDAAADAWPHQHLLQPCMLSRTSTNLPPLRALRQTLGQGINAALEDTAVLGRLQTCQVRHGLQLRLAELLVHTASNAGAACRQHPSPAHAPALQGCGVDALPQLFHEARHADAMAAVVLTERAYGGKHAVSRAAIVQSMLRMSLHRLLPGLMRAPALHLMNETVAGYAAILGLAEEEERVLNTAALGVGVGAAAAVAFAAALLATTARAVAASIGVGVLLAGAGM